MSSILPAVSWDILSQWHYVFAYGCPLFMFLIFLNSLSHTRSHVMCDQVGFPQPRAQHGREERFNAFFYLFAQRCLSIGLVLTILEANGEWRAVTVVLACMCVNGVRDGWLVISHGDGGMAKAMSAHWGLTVLGGLATWRLFGEHW